MAGKIMLIILLNLVWAGALFGVLIFPAMPDFAGSDTIDQVLGAMLCAPGERLQRAPELNAALPDLEIGMTPYCVNTGDETRRDVSGSWLTIGLGTAAVGFVLATLVELWLAFSLTQKKAQLAGRSALGSAKPNLNERLQQLEQARQAGSISYDEYDQMRSKILREMTEQ